MAARGKERRRAFTAFEALIAVSILAFMATSVSTALMAGRQQSRTARDMVDASMLGRALLDEVMRLPATDPSGYTTLGPDAGETRVTFNSVKDYSGYGDGPGNVANAGGVMTPMTDLAGNAYPTELQNFSRIVVITPVAYTPLGWSTTLSGLQVAVTVYRNGNAVLTLQRVAFY